MEKQEENVKFLSIRMPEATWKKVRKVAFVHEMRMAEVVRRGIELFLKEKEKEAKKY